MKCVLLEAGTELFKHYFGTPQETYTLIYVLHPLVSTKEKSMEHKLYYTILLRVGLDPFAP
jgi:hypothetical protein